MSDDRDPRGTDWLLTRITPDPPKEGTVSESFSSDGNRPRPSGGTAYLLLALLIVAIVGAVLIVGAGR